MINADPVDEQPKPQSRGQQRPTKERDVIRVLCELAAKGVSIAKVRNRKADLLLKREVENQLSKFGKTISRQTFFRGLARYRKGERSE